MKRKINAENANKLLLNKEITEEEHAEFFINYCYQSFVDKETRDAIDIEELQSNGTVALCDATSMGLTKLILTNDVFWQFSQCLLTLSEKLSENMALMNQKRDIGEDLIIKSKVNVLTFSDIDLIIDYAVTIPSPICSRTCLESSLAFNIERAWRSLSVLAATYQMMILHFGGKVA